ncbi:unnamed protein product [Somion occarium]|uniref:Uncharacterized protein n=1 Tax=Somion occarium TaxID=3059160 RepID=A0ABP1E8L1_9APHY
MSTEHETKVESEELVVAPIDERLYSLEPDELEFFKSWTKIQDEEELKRHILKSQADAYAVYPYPCIRRFSFTKLKISRFPAYQDLLQLGRERPGALFIDLGCCFGNDVRKAVADGFPVQQALASDLRPGFWEVGHQLFKDTKETFPVPFIPGDVFDIKFVSDEPGKVETTTELPPLSSLINLTPLLGCLFTSRKKSPRSSPLNPDRSYSARTLVDSRKNIVPKSQYWAYQTKLCSVTVPRAGWRCGRNRSSRKTKSVLGQCCMKSKDTNLPQS